MERGGDVGNDRGGEAVGLEEFVEEGGKWEVDGGEFGEVDGLHVQVEIRDAGGAGLDEALAQFVDVGAVDELGVVEAPDVGLHGVVDGGVELAEQRHELVAYAVAAGVELGVGVVFHILEAVPPDVVVDVGAAEGEHGMDDSYGF